jgi:hypothetical protein
VNTPKDFTTDEALTFLHLLKEASVLPTWVDGVHSSEDVAHLPTTAFADTANRLFPIHGKSATFLSAVSAFVYGTETGPWESRLKAACHAYGITGEVKAAHEALAKEDAIPEAPEKAQKIACALELTELPGGPATGYYPMHTNHAVETSLDKLAEDIHHNRLPESYFSEAAEKLVKAAAEFGIREKQIPARVRELGEVRLPSPEYLSYQVDLRQKQAGFPDEMADAYREAAANVLEKQASIADAAHLWELADMKFQVKVAGALVSPVKAFKSGRTVDSLWPTSWDPTAICFLSVRGSLLPALRKRPPL